MTDPKVKTGIQGLDALLHGGLIPGRPYIITGPSGSGKSVLGMQFLVEGLNNGERVLLVALEEPPNEIRFNMESFGWRAGEVEVLDANSDIRRFEPKPVLEISSEEEPLHMKNVPAKIRKSPEGQAKEVTVHSLQQLLKNLFIRTHYTRVVIDSLTALRMFCMRDFEENMSVQSFMRFLSEAKVTAFLTVETPEGGESKLESFLARGEIRLHKFRHERGIKRFISIEKYKGSSYEEVMAPIEIKDSGIVVYADLV